LLEALLMQISGVSLTLTWPRRLCLLRVLLGMTATATSFPLSKHTGGGDTAPAFSGQRVYLQFTGEAGLSPFLVEFSSHRHFYKLSHSCLLWTACLFTVHVGSGPSPALLWSFPHHHFYKLFHSWLLSMCFRSCLLWPACLFTVP
jgi:hypothetical protein